MHPGKSFSGLMHIAIRRGSYVPCENGRAHLVQCVENKKSSRPDRDPEDCTRFFILTVPQPTREWLSPLWAGLLAHGSSYSPRLPILIGQWSSRVSSPFTAAGPRGLRTLFPDPRVIMVRHSGRARQKLSSSLLFGFRGRP